MPHVTVIGTGNMGQAIAGVLTKGGATVDLVGHAETDADVSGDIVVLAVPYPALDDVLAKRADRLEGKVFVDITNPLNFETFDSLTVAADGSAAAELAQRLPPRRFSRRSTRPSPRPWPPGRSETPRPRCSSPGTTRPRRRRWPTS